MSLREIGNLLPNNRRQRRTCYALCHILYPVSAAHTRIFRMDSNSTSYHHVPKVLPTVGTMEHRLGGPFRSAAGTRILLLLLYSRTGPRRALSLKLSDTRVHAPEIRTRLGRS